MVMPESVSAQSFPLVVRSVIPLGVVVPVLVALLGLAERALGLQIDDFADTVTTVATEYEPHKLASYLYSLASAFTTFYDQCPVLKAEDPTTVQNRLFLCDITGRTLRMGMELLGIETPETL